VPSISLPTAPAPAPVGYDPDTQQFFVNGYVYHRDDYEGAVAGEAALSRPAVRMPPNYEPVSPSEYRQHLARAEDHIENPVSAYIGDIFRKFRRSRARSAREHEQTRSNIEKALDRCYAIAENKYPGDFDAQQSYANQCVENLPWSR